MKAKNLPMWTKLAYSGFVAVLVPYYWCAYGPTNFLYFCDVALILTVFALWWESPLLASMPAVGIVFPQMLWCVDFVAEAVGLHLAGLTGYMFSPTLSLFTRGLSFFHFWLPFLLIWLVWKLGYDRRALAGWTFLAWTLMLVSYLWLPAPPAPVDNPNLPVNVNYVHGFSDTEPQSWLPANLYLVVLMIAMPAIIFLPTHWLLKKCFERDATSPMPAAA